MRKKNSLRKRLDEKILKILVGVLGRHATHNNNKYYNFRRSYFPLQLSRRMQKGHLRLKTLKSIVQTRDVTAKTETQNFVNHKICTSR